MYNFVRNLVAPLCDFALVINKLAKCFRGERERERGGGGGGGRERERERGRI